jgi:integrase
VRAVLARVDGTAGLLISLLYGSGLRLLESCRLRVQDIDFGRHELMIRRGKGARDRRTMLPSRIESGLVAHLERVKAQHAADLRAGAG